MFESDAHALIFVFDAREQLRSARKIALGAGLFQKKTGLPQPLRAEVAATPLERMRGVAECLGHFSFRGRPWPR